MKEEEVIGWIKAADVRTMAQSMVATIGMAAGGFLSEKERNRDE